MLPIVDTHQHLWDLTKFTLPWLKPGDALHTQHTTKEYAAATAGLNIVKSVYMEVGMAAADRQREVDYVVEICKSGTTPMCAAVVGGDLASAGFEQYARQLKDSPHVKGIRHMLHVEGVKASDGLKPDFLNSLHLLGELGLSFDLCIRPQEIADATKIVTACPGTRFILDHCGNPHRDFTTEQTHQWQAGLAALAARDNVVCKVSGILANGFQRGEWTAQDLAPFVNATLDTFGPDRVMFGGDWPVLTGTASYSEWVNALKQIVSNRSEDQQRKLFHDNAVKFYGLA